MVLGHIMTAMPNRLRDPRGVAAPPGIAIYNVLPLTFPRGVVAQA